jgi:hypothetical protein
MRKVLVIALLFALMFAVAGCKKRQAAAKGSTTQAPGGGGLGVVQQVKGAVQRTVTAKELDDLRIYIDTASLASGRMPNKETILKEVKTADRKLGQLIEDGAIVLTGATQREGVWAYEKDAPERGGMVLTSTGVERLSADELNQRLGMTR